MGVHLFSVQDFIYVCCNNIFADVKKTAQRIKKLSKSGKCTVEAMREIMSEEKKSDLDKITIEPDEIKKYFPRSFTPSQMKDTILKLLDNWLKNRTKKRNTERS